jgi:peptide/nickel transport system ATP-binding protein
VAQACDRVVVLYAGRVAETDTTEALFANPHHPYSASLIACIPAHDQAAGTLSGIPGTVPGVANYPAGCRFHPRCDRALAVCAGEVPAITALPTGTVACHLYGANA